MRKKILALMLTVMIGSAQVMTVSAAKTTDELEQQKAQTTAQLSETQDTINNLEEQKQAMYKLIPLGCLGETQDIANAVKFLVSDDARYITGVVLKVDGGMYI